MAKVTKIETTVATTPPVKSYNGIELMVGMAVVF